MSHDQPPPDAADFEPSAEPLPDISIEVAAESQDRSPPAISAATEAAAPTLSEAASSEASSTARRVASRTAPENDEILPQTLLRLMGEAIVAAQPPLKQQGIKALRGTIQLLEKTVERLEAEPAPKQAQKGVPASGEASENTLPSSSQKRVGKLAPMLSTGALREAFQTAWQQLRRSWRRLLRQIRDRLPASINRNWSDQALTGAIVSILAIGLWSIAALLPDQATPTPVAKPPVAIVAPSPTPSITPISPVVKAPEAPKPVEISPTPASLPPSPPLKVTPEQPLIARIQVQVAAISNQYANGLVETVQANFRSSRLIVHISGGWYGLGRSQQDSLANELLRRTQTLDFSKLELVDGAGKLLARSPVVGAEMIILKRATATAQST